MVSDPVAVHDVHSLLSNPRRRYLLEELQEDRTKTLEELSAEIADRESGPSVATDGGTAEIAVSLVHNHLPKLADYDVVEWDRDAGVVTRNDGFVALQSVLDENPTETSSSVT